MYKASSIPVLGQLADGSRLKRPYPMLLMHKLRHVFPINAYLEDRQNPRPRQPDVDWVDVGDHVSHSLENVQELHHLVRLVGKIYLAGFVVT
jgi:hypothetical protein